MVNGMKKAIQVACISVVVGTAWSCWAIPAYAQTLVHTTATLSEGRGFIAATSVADKALFAGGRTTQSLSFSDVVDIYDADTGIWSTANLSEARSFIAATSVGDKALHSHPITGSILTVRAI
jgi:hypothetical protein